MSAQQVLAFGDWIQVATGPGILTVLTRDNTVRASASPVIPTAEDFDAPIALLTRGRGQLTVLDDSPVWAQIQGAQTEGMVSNGIPCYIQWIDLVEDAPGEPAEAEGGPTIVPEQSYAAGNVIGGPFRISGVLQGPSGILRSISIKSNTVLTGNLKLYLFSGKPVNSNFADNTQPVLDPLDSVLLSAAYILTPVDSGLGVTLYQGTSLGVGVSSSNGDLWGLLVPDGGSLTFDGATDLLVSVAVTQG